MEVRQRHKVKLGKVRLERPTKAFHTFFEKKKKKKIHVHERVHIRRG